ncbi:MAG: glycosyl hydrolase [Acidimicrobiales bacterium]
MAFNLIPANLQNINDPLNWETSCAAGDFDAYATTLGKSLVAAGLQNSVLRLGPEMNGMWESDFVGARVVEQHLWAKCFANEAASLRSAAGEHFLMDWNPNACVENYPYANFYPGNKFVDIMGLDLYDVGCDTPNVPLTFPQLSSEPAGLTRFEAFANAHGKPMSLPEWGLVSAPSGDDPAYVDGIGETIANGDFAFESYFNVSGVGNPGLSVLPLGPSTPLSLVAYQQWFGSSQ